MRLPSPRGPLSTAVVTALADGRPERARDTVCAERTRDRVGPEWPVGDPSTDDDLHLALWTLYELHYRGFEGVDPGLEWDPDLLAARRALETPFEVVLREQAAPVVAGALAAADDVPGQLEHVIASVDGAPLAGYVQRRATRDQLLELLALKSVYTLKEADPTSFALPRLEGSAKVALAELQYDEYGGGRPERMHARLYAEGLRACGLDDGYGGYVDRAPGHLLAVNNALSLVNLHRRLRGASLGHLAAFEATSSLPSRRIAAGIRRLDLAEEMWAYFDEHVEADAVHEQVALRDICAAAVEHEPDLLADVLLGAAVCQQVEAASGERVLAAWESGRSAMRDAAVDYGDALEAVPA